VCCICSPSCRKVASGKVNKPQASATETSFMTTSTEEDLNDVLSDSSRVSRGK